MKHLFYFLAILTALSCWTHTINAQDTTAPTVSIDTPSGTQTEAFFAVTVTFSEVVTGFVQDELVVTGSSGAIITDWEAETGGTDYTATITPMHDGSVVLNVAANVAEDGANNPNTAATQQTVPVLIPEAVWMPDDDLRTLIRSSDGLNIPTGTALTQADMKRASFISLTSPSNLYISDLTGLEYATQLTTINLADNGITNLTPLAGLTNLTFLQLDENKGITDFSALADLNNLTQVHFNYTEIAGAALGSLAAQLTDLTGLTLGLSGNEISNLTPLGGLTNLGNLDVNGNDISDLTPLGGLTNLQELDISYNFSITDLTPLGSLTNLQKLVSAGLNISTLMGLEACTSLDILNLEDTEGLRDLTAIRDLGLSELDISKSVGDTSYFSHSGPNVSITVERSGTTLNVIITFSEAVEDFELTDLQITGGSATSLVELEERDGDRDVEDDTDNSAYNTPIAVYGTTITPDVSAHEVVITLAAGAVQAKRRTDLRYLYNARYNAAGSLLIKLPRSLRPNTANTSRHGADPPQLKEPNEAVEVRIDTLPPSVSIIASDGPHKEPFDVTVVFSEVVTGFEQSELGVSGTSGATITAWDAQTNGTHYVATITPTQTGTAIFNVAANVAKDEAENDNTAATEKTVTVDMDLPSVSIEGPSDVQNGAFDVTVVFSETVTDFVQSELGVSGTSGATITAWDPQTGDTHYVATITPTQTGTAIFNVAANAAKDEAGNDNTAATEKTVTVDMTSPTVSINVPSAPQGSVFDVTVVFSETVTDFVQSELGVSGTSGASITAWVPQTGGTDYVATITPTQTGTAIFNVAANAAKDEAGNDNTAATEKTVTVDMMSPTVSINVPSAPQGSVFDVTVVFSEVVTGFVQSELGVSGTSGATITAWDPQTGGTHYVATVTSTASGTAIFNVAVNVAKDEAGNDNTAATEKTVSVDMDLPSVSIEVPSDVQNGAFDVTVVFSEAVTDFVQSELGVSGTSGATITAWDPQTNGTHYVATITPTQTGTAIFNVAVNVAKDEAQNGNTMATQKTVQVDMTRPTVSINVPSDVPGEVFNVTVAFSEPVSDFVRDELVVSGTSGASITNWVPQTGDTDYVATITSSQTGQAIFNVAANIAMDAVGNLNTAATQKTVEVDMTRPEARITAPSDEQFTAFNVRVIFTEPVTGFERNELAVSGTSAASITNWTPKTGGREYIATITPTRTGMVEFNIAANVAADNAGNLNTAATQQIVEVDMDSPRVKIIVPPGKMKDDFEVMVEFSESVAGFTRDELVVTGTSGAKIKHWQVENDRECRATITAVQTGTAIFNVPENVAEDGAGHLNLAAQQQIVEVDLTPPTVTIDVPTRAQGGAFEVTVRFSEPVNGFVEEHLLISEPRDVRIIRWEVQADQQVYIATIIPNIDINMLLAFRVATDVAEDDAGNRNEASETKEVRIDTQGPCPTLSVAQEIQTGPFEVVVFFSEPVSGFEQNKLVLTGMLEARLTNWRIRNDGSDYHATIIPSPFKRTDPTASVDGGTVTLSLTEGIAVDEVGNESKGIVLKTVTVAFPEEGEDTRRPWVALEVPNDTQAGAFDVRIVFTEPVNDFSETDLEVHPSHTPITNWGSDADRRHYTATINPKGNGSVTLNIAENVAEDDAGNGNHAANDKNVEVVFSGIVDTVNPTVTIVVPDGDQIGAFDVRIQFSEPVTGFRQSALHISDTCFSITRWQPNPDRKGYIATITSIQDGTVTLSVPENIVQDASGNWNTTAAEVTVTVELPEARVYIEAPTTVRDVFEVTVVFTTAVTGFRQEELIFSDDSTAEVTITDWVPHSGGTRYIAEITPTKNGALMLTVLAGAAEQWNTAAETIRILISPEDVNQDGMIDVQDSLLVAENFGEYVASERAGNPDVNRNGVVDIEDFELVEAQTAATTQAAPTNPRTLQSLIEHLKTLDNNDPIFQRSLQALESRLVALVPKTTALLPNYPNPFNPETWIPYHLGTDNNVTIFIYDMSGRLIRSLEIGNQRAGYYTTRNRAAYWDGMNNVGERVASGIYFYQLQAGNVSLLQKMVILK